MRRSLSLALMAMAVIAGCNKDKGGEPATNDETPKPETKRAEGKSSATEKIANTPKKPVALPPGRTPLPTLDEWNNQRKEVTVKGSSALNCETKMVREYLRVSCHGKNDSGGTPTALKVKKGGHGDVYTFASGNVTSLVVPFVEGIDLAADFSWTDKAHTLTLKWPRGSSKPVIIGVFEGAHSPLDATPTALADRLCACHKKVMKRANCEDLFGMPNSDCDRTYGGDCTLLLECSRGEPSAIPTCLPGYVHVAMNFCAKECGAGKPPCPSGHTCSDMGDGATKICVEND